VAQSRPPFFLSSSPDPNLPRLLPQSPFKPGSCPVKARKGCSRRGLISGPRCLTFYASLREGQRNGDRNCFSSCTICQWVSG
jgi:hypothetical protein